MKSEKAEKYLFENGLGYPYTGYVTEQAAERAVELAEREAFAALIDKVSGRGTWASNPWVVVYEFELMK